MTAKRLTALLLGVMPVLPGTMPMLLGVAPVLPEVVAVSALTATADEAAQPPEETPSAHVACERFGDANRNGVIDVTDATLIQYFLAQPAEDTDSLRQSALVMDVDRSGAVDISDATQVQRFVAEFPDCAHVGSPIGAVEEHRLPTALSLREKSLTLGVGECVPLTPVSDVEELPDGMRWQFTSNDPQVASVSPDGVITALSCGVAEVTCACGDVLDSCTVSVQRAASSLTLNADTLLLGVGEAFAFESETDAGAAAYHRQYETADESVASVDADTGALTANGVGNTVISCTLQNGVRADCPVEVLPLPDSFLLNAEEVTLEVGETFDFNSTLPEGTAAYYRSYFTGDSSIAEIERWGGVVTGNREGTTQICCELQNGVRTYATIRVVPAFRSIMVRWLREQVGKNNLPYAEYINKHSSCRVSKHFAWCAVFAWCGLDRFASLSQRENPVAARTHVSELAVQARKKGALMNIYDTNYVPKPGDLFTTSKLKRPVNDNRLHIGFVESVELDANGKVVKVHTIEGNFNWETKSATQTKVARGEWVPGKKDRYGAALCEFIDLEALFA